MNGVALLSSSTLTSLKTRREMVIDILRKAILDGALLPGQTLNQDELALQLGISRTPIREALHTLAAEGLVQLQAHQVAVVPTLSSSEIDDIFAVRVILEGEAAFLGVPLLGENDMAHLRDLVASMREPGLDPAIWLPKNEDFHQTIYAASGLRRLCNLIAEERNAVRPYIAAAAFLLNRKASSDHADILDACERRDGLAAKQNTIHHLVETQSALKDWMQTRATTAPATTT